MERLGFIHEKLDIKILILFILRRLPGAVEPSTLVDLCVQCDDGIGYFDYSDCLVELVETGHIDEGEEGYEITYGNGIVNMEAFAKALKEEWNVTLDKASVNMDIDQTAKLEAEVNLTWSAEEAGEDGAAAGDDSVIWSSSNESVVAVDEEGNLEPKAAGTAVITAESNVKKGKKAECKVTVFDQYDIASSTVSAAGATYTGAAQKPAPSVKIRGTQLKNGTDYTVSWKNNVNAGKASLTVTGKGSYHGSKTVSFTIAKAKQKMTVKAQAKRVRAKKLKKKNQTVKKAIAVKGAQGKVTYKKLSGSSRLKINQKNGKITVKKGKKKGTLRMKVRVSASGNGNYLPFTKTVTVKIQVK